jgi:hypothetical protein
LSNVVLLGQAHVLPSLKFGQGDVRASKYVLQGAHWGQTAKVHSSAGPVKNDSLQPTLISSRALISLRQHPPQFSQWFH